MTTVKILVACGISAPIFAQTEQPLSERERQLLERIEKLEQRVAALEPKAAPPPAITQAAPPAATDVDPKDSASLPGFLNGTTLNFYFDGYYGFNTNRPIGRINLLRANDVLANTFALNQADVMVERAPDAAAGRRFGMRLDLMWGQNTETLQGSSLNEARPQVYRNVYQAYGTYVAPVGSGLTMDFGKFSSSLGIETNYAKDQSNYSRSYFFDLLPFYHMGVRATYNFNDKLSAQYWLVNGANQTESFNNFKSNAFLFTIKPRKNISWNVDYFFGAQGRDVTLGPVIPRPNGKLHIFDTYVAWNATSKLSAAAEFDYVVNRDLANSAPAHITGGAGYLKYQITSPFSLAARGEYLSDRDGFFSGRPQALKEITLTAAYQPVDGFQIKTEYRRDFSNLPFFLSNSPGVLKKEQNTALVGLLWWFGGKQGAW